MPYLAGIPVIEIPAVQPRATASLSRGDVETAHIERVTDRCKRSRDWNLLTLHTEQPYLHT